MDESSSSGWMSAGDGLFAASACFPTTATAWAVCVWAVRAWAFSGWFIPFFWWFISLFWCFVFGKKSFRKTLESISSDTDKKSEFIDLLGVEPKTVVQLLDKEVINENIIDLCLSKY